GGGVGAAQPGRVPRRLLRPAGRHRLAARGSGCCPRAAHRVRTGQGRLRGRLRAGPPARLGWDPPVRGIPTAELMSQTQKSNAKKTDPAVERLVAGRHADPHQLLGVQKVEGRAVVRAWVPGGAEGVTVVFPSAAGEVAATREHPAGLWQADAPDGATGYHLRIQWPGGVREER